MLPAGDFGQDRADDPYVLFVNNLPVELTEVGIRQMFESYGKVGDIFTTTRGTWAYVSYKTYKDAELAIRKLNGQEPLRLHVAFRKRRVHEEDPDRKKQPSVYVDDPIASGNVAAANAAAEAAEAEPRLSTCGSATPFAGRAVKPEELAKFARVLDNISSAVDANSIYPTDADDNIYNPFENIAHAEANALWSRGCMCIDARGRKIVTLGRGFNKYYIPDVSYPLIEQQIAAMHEKRQARPHDPEKEKERIAVRACLYCKTAALLRCSECLQHYCSRKCQMSDLMRHFGECTRCPNLAVDLEGLGLTGTTDDGSTSYRKNRSSSSDPIFSPRPPKKSAIPKPGIEASPEEELRMIEEQQKLEEQRKLEQQRTKPKWAENIPAKEQALASAPKKGPISPTESEDFSSGSIQAQAEVHARPKSASPRDPKSSSTPSETKMSSSYLQMEEALAFTRESRTQMENVDAISEAYSGRLISTKNYEKVRVVYLMKDNTFWVQKVADIPAFAEMMDDLLKVADNLPKVTNLKVGNMYATTYEGIWHRATIVTLNPTTVLFVDYGNTEEPQTDDFRSLEKFDKPYPPFALHLQLSPHSNLKNIVVDLEFSAKMVKIDCTGLIQVLDLETEKLSYTPPKGVVAKEPVPKVVGGSLSQLLKNREETNLMADHSIDKFNVGDEGVILFFFPLNHNSYTGVVMPTDMVEDYMNLTDQMQKDCGEAKTPDYNLLIGDFICGFDGNTWYRGLVESYGPPLRIAAVDDACLIPVNKFTSIPKQYSKMCIFGSIVTFSGTLPTIEKGTIAQFKVHEIDEQFGQNNLQVVLFEPKELKDVTVTLTKWQASPEQRGVQTVPLENNCKVIISAYRSERLVYLRRIDPEMNERNELILQKTCKLAENAPKLKNRPVIGELVFAQFTDNNFYRAIVTKYFEEKISVSYIDYGNMELTTLDKLREMPTELKTEKGCCTKAVLKGITTDEPPTKEVHEYLGLLAGNEEPLLCTFEGTSPKDGVILKTLKGEIVNDVINRLMIPSWQREDPSKNLSCFMFDKLEVKPLGDVGEVIEAVLLSTNEPGFKYSLVRLDPEYINYVSADLCESLNKYAESRKEHYIPRFNELCVAFFETSWYRGVCIDPSTISNHVLIQFVDYGNVAAVEYKNIREFTKDFMNVPAMAANCLVKNLGLRLEDGRIPEKTIERLNVLVPENRPVRVKILKKSEPDTQEVTGDYEIELPEVKQKLVEEGLATLRLS